MVNNSDTKVSYQGNGQTTVFPFSFPFIQSDYIKVAIYDSLTDETKTIDSDYYVDTVANAVIYPGYEPGQEPAEALRPPILPATSTITIYRQTDVDQLTDLGEKYPLKDIENMADKLTEIIQEQAETLERAVKVPVGDPKTPEEKLTDLQNYVKAAADSAADAADSEASAQRAAEAAATSEANAAESERLAGGYADTASDAASRAEDSAISARAYNAPNYDNTVTYQAGEVVTFTDGNSYRALQETTGHEPPNIIYWQKVTDYVGDNFFEIDEYGYIVPMDSPSHSRYWRVDQNGYIVPIEGGDGGYRPDTRSLSAEYLNVTNEGYIKHLRADDISAQEVDADEMTAETAAFNTLTANAFNAQSASVTEISAGKVTADEVDNKDKVEYLFPDNVVTTNHGDCQIIKTNDKVLMIDSGAVGQVTANHIIDYCLAHGINKIDYFLVTHYHQDHYLNIQYFLAQNQVDFSNTIWYVPPHILDSDLSEYNTVKSWLAGKTVYETTADFEFKLSSTVTVSCFNCNEEDRQHYINAGITDLNPFSTCAFVTHKNTSVLFMADATGEAQNWLYQQGKYRRSELLKVAHHGIGEAGNYFYLNQISPLYAVCNMCLDESTTLDNADYGAISDNLNILSAITPECLHYTQNGACEFISDGTSIEDVSDDSTKVSRTTSAPTQVDFYVDTNGSNLVCDGSQTRPFRTINQAFTLMPNNSNIWCNLHLQNDNYAGNMTVENRCNYTVINASSVTLPEIYIHNSNNIRISATSITCNNIDISNVRKINLSGTFITKRLTVDCSDMSAAKIICQPQLGESVVLSGSNIAVSNFTLDCSAYTSSASTREMLILRTNAMLDISNFVNCGIAVVIKNGSMLSGYQLSAENVSTLISVPDTAGALVQIATFGTMTNVTNNKGGYTKFVDLPPDRQKEE